MTSTQSEFQKAVEEFKRQHNEEISREMFVYFDQSGNIKCISPLQDAEHHDRYLHTKKKLFEVYKFITGELAPNRYKIEKVDGKIGEYEIKKRSSEVSYVRTLERFLTEIVEGYEKRYELEIIADESSKIITFKFTDEVRQEIIGSVEDIFQATIHGLKVLKFYCTTKNDPSMLVESFEVPIHKLLSEGAVEMDYNVDIRDYSIFTRRVLNKYGYKIIGE